MRFLVAAVCSIALLTGAPAPTQAQAEMVAGLVVSGMTLDEVMDGMVERVDGLLEAAVKDGEYLEEKALRSVLIALDNLDAILADQQDTAWRNLDRQTQGAIRTLGETVDRAEGLKEEILELEDFLVLDIQSLINDLPFTADRYLLRKIEGYSQAYQEEGAYSFRLLGNAFQADHRLSVTVAGTPVPPERIFLGERANEVRFDVPATTLNRHFRRSASSRVPLTVTVAADRPIGGMAGLLPWNWGKTKRKGIATVSQKLLLLPIEAATYSLVEHRAVEKLGEPDWTDWGTWTTIPKLGRNCKDCGRCPGCGKAKCRDICVAVPAGSRVVRDAKGAIVQQSEDDGDAWGSFCGSAPAEASGQVCRQYRNWRRSYDHRARIRVRVQPVESTTEPVPLPLARLGLGAAPTALASLPGAGASGQGEGLRFGLTYDARLSPEYRSFDLVLKLFNGKELALTPGSNPDPGLLRFSLETAGDFNRLTVALKKPW